MCNVISEGYREWPEVWWDVAVVVAGEKKEDAHLRWLCVNLDL